MEGIHFDFNDTRLDDRGLLCLSKMTRDPGRSFPEIFEKPKDLEGFYRFINNPKVEVQKIENGVFGETYSRLSGVKEALAIHDTTQVIPISKKGIPEFIESKGFFAHLSLLVSAEKTKQIYGAIGLKLWNRSEEKKVFDNEAYRWIDQMNEVEQRATNLSLIH